MTYLKNHTNMKCFVDNQAELDGIKTAKSAVGSPSLQVFKYCPWFSNDFFFFESVHFYLVKNLQHNFVSPRLKLHNHYCYNLHN